MRELPQDDHGLVQQPVPILGLPFGVPFLSFLSHQSMPFLLPDAPQRRTDLRRVMDSGTLNDRSMAWEGTAQ